MLVNYVVYLIEVISSRRITGENSTTIPNWFWTRGI